MSRFVRTMDIAGFFVTDEQAAVLIEAGRHVCCQTCVLHLKASCMSEHSAIVIIVSALLDGRFLSAWSL